MKIQDKYVSKNSLARVVGAVSLALFLLLLVWLASLMVIASLSVAQGYHDGTLFVGTVSLHNSTFP